MSSPPRTAADILADLQALDRENDRLEHRLALVRQSLKAAEAHAQTIDENPTAVARHLDIAAARLRAAG
ncbi:MAG: hypothetical protein AAF911_05350 [Planctomycetota bacterium]